MLAVTLQNSAKVNSEGGGGGGISEDSALCRVRLNLRLGGAIGLCLLQPFLWRSQPWQKKKQKQNKKKTPHSSMTMTNVSAPYLLQLTVQRLRVTSCQDYTDVFRSSFIFIYFFILSRGSICATSQTARYRRAAADLFSSRLLLLRGLDGRADLGD